MRREQVPNALTVVRLALAGVFVALVSAYQFPGVNGWALPWSIVVFTLAAGTDALDGFLARRWQAVSVFGRVMDPVADKVLVLGAFVMLCGPGFANGLVSPLPASGVAPWMAVVILSRELLVTSIRGVMESRGVDFSASWSGKLKMIVQSVGVPVILLGVLFIERTPQRLEPLVRFNQGVAWGVTIVTAWSALPYVVRGLRAARTLDAAGRGGS